MVVVSYSGREINAKIVYYGPGLSGKTTNLEKIYDSVPETNRGRMVSMKTQTDRTLFFDLLPLDLGDLQGMKTRLLLYTVPGQVYYNATRKLVLKGVDAVVFVADSAADKMTENRESFSNLEMNLKAYGIDIRSIPLVIQFNKRDLPNAVSVEDLNRELNRLNVPWFEAQAANGVGVFETLRGVSKLLLAKISKDVLEKDKGAVAGLSRAKSSAAATGQPRAETASPAKPDRGASGGKLLKYLKRGKGAHGDEQEADVQERDRSGAEIGGAAAPPRGARTPAEPSPLLDDEALVEDAPPPEVSRPLNAEEELVLSEADLVEQPEARDTRPVRPSGGLGAATADEDSIGDFEREPGGISPGLGSARLHSVDAGSGDARRIVVPIDLGALPRSGRVTLSVEISIRVDSDEPRKGAAGGRKSGGLDESFTRDLEPIP